jgi:hypothetical protein
MKFNEHGQSDWAAMNCEVAEGVPFDAAAAGWRLFLSGKLDRHLYRPTSFAADFDSFFFMHLTFQDKYPESGWNAFCAD